MRGFVPVGPHSNDDDLIESAFFPPPAKTVLIPPTQRITPEGEAAIFACVDEPDIRIAEILKQCS
ncbi:hypothetical protein [Streptomyces sp. NPDC056921]|uniref:hypothetical protein n=1 Tax=Streptomyces sp. NPDC056921 TaxID=3345966 RepID=UPI003639835B